MLYRTLIAFAAPGRVNSTYCPGRRLTARRPDASAGSVYALVPKPMMVPLVVAFSASCSAKPTVAPRPATRDGSRAARVTTGPAEPASALPPTHDHADAEGRRGRRDGRQDGPPARPARPPGKSSCAAP
jgi:hypothetical protein